LLRRPSGRRRGVHGDLTAPGIGDGFRRSRHGRCLEGDAVVGGVWHRRSPGRSRPAPLPVRARRFDGDGGRRPFALLDDVAGGHRRRRHSRWGDGVRRTPGRVVRSAVMSVVSRGFRGRRAADVDPARVPPGQYVTKDFPVLSAGPTPHTSLEQWDFSIVGELAQPRRWNWDEFRALPNEEIIRDIHCVTKWSKLDTVWQGVSVDTLLEGIETSA